MLESQESDVRRLEDVLRRADLPAVVRWVQDPHEVLFAAEDETVDIAVLNLELPGVDDAIVEELRMLEGDHRLPIIAFSDSEPEDADHVFSRPREDFEYFGIVHAIRIYWMARAPTLAAPRPPKAPSECPRRLSVVDVMSLPIKPAEAYLLSMIDGRMSVDEVSLSIGSELKETRAMLRRLTEMGAVSWRPAHPSLAPPAPPVFTRVSSLPEAQGDEREPAAGEPPVSEPLVSEPRVFEPRVFEPLAGHALRPGPPPARASAPEPSQKVLSAERKKIVDDAYALLGETDHYQLLGVARDADRRAVRAAYFELAKLFHTDTLFGVELGAYASKMDKVFRQLTEAYEVLSKSTKRRAYDAYLEAVRETRSLDESPTPSLAPPSPRRDDAETPTSESASDRAPEDPPSSAPEPGSVGEPPSRDRTSRKRVARELLQKRLGAPASPAVSSPERGGAVKALARALQAVSRGQPRTDRAALLIADAAKAEQGGNVAGAAEALRIAAAWRPQDEELARKAEALRLRALDQKVPAYQQRARYAERNESWEEAALCWMKVCEVRPRDMRAALSAARALTEARGDLREAALYARRATELEPTNPQTHLVLAEIYIAAGMPASASPALQTVLQLAPGDRRAKELLEELRA